MRSVRVQFPDLSFLYKQNALQYYDSKARPVATGSAAEVIDVYDINLLIESTEGGDAPMRQHDKIFLNLYSFSHSLINYSSFI